MRRFAATFLSAGVFFTLLAAPAWADDDALTKAIEKDAALQQYTFQIDEKPGKGAGSGVEGTYQKGQPVYLKADKISYFKAGDVLVYKQGETWKRSKRGTESDPLTVLGAVAKVNAARLPHEEFAGLEKLLTGIKKGDKMEDGCAVYSADLTEEGAKQLAPVESKGVARSGTLRAWINADGLIVKYVVSIRLKGKRGNAEVDGTAEKTVRLADLGSAKVEVPEGAKKALE
jgi:hypothetical protein